MIETLCNAIVARLKERLPQFKVEHFPDAPHRYPWTSAREALLVGYEGSTYGQVESISPASTPRTVETSVTLIVRSLRGSLGAMSVLEQVRRALFGWRPAVLDPDTNQPLPLGFTALVPLREGFVSEDQGIWRFVQTFSCTTIAVAETEGLTGPPLKGVTIKDA